MVPASEFDEYCVWHLYGSGKQNRPIEHSVLDGHYLDPSSFSVVTGSANSHFLTFDGNVERTTIDDLRYDTSTGQFSIDTANPSEFQFFSVGDTNSGVGELAQDVLEKIEQSETTQRLSDIHRNEFVNLHIIFNP